MTRMRLAVIISIGVSMFWGCSDPEGVKPADIVPDAVEVVEDTALDGADWGDTAPLDVPPDNPNDIQGAEVEQDTPGDPSEDLVIPDGPWDVTEPGYYNIGYLNFDVEYRPEGMDEDRTLRVSAWYPTLQTSGAPGAYMGFWQRREVFQNAQPAPGSPFPVLVFSHGHLSIGEQSFFMTEFFASHGWLVVSPDHTGNTFMDSRDPTPPELFYLRPLDLSAVLDGLNDLEVDHLLYGAASDDVVVSGHSFGGNTTLAIAGAGIDVEGIEEACQSGTVHSVICDAINPETLAMAAEGFGDERFRVAIPQAPGGVELFGPEYAAEIEIPVLLITGALDRTTPDATEGDPLWAALDGEDDLRLDFTTGGHFTFSNLCDLLPSLGEGDGCGEGFIEPEEGYRIVNAYALAFARHHLWGDESVTALLDGTDSLSEEVVLEIEGE